MEGSQLVKAVEAARALGISKCMLYRLAAEKSGVYRIGTRGVRFDVSELREALRRPAAQEEGR